MGVLLSGDTLSDAKLHIFVKTGNLHSIKMRQTSIKAALKQLLFYK